MNNLTVAQQLSRTHKRQSSGYYKGCCTVELILSSSCGCVPHQAYINLFTNVVDGLGFISVFNTDLHQVHTHHRLAQCTLNQPGTTEKSCTHGGGWGRGQQETECTPKKSVVHHHVATEENVLVFENEIIYYYYSPVSVVLVINIHNKVCI